ncbi:MAG: phosphate ABC transporter ATP-binding protein [Candidatus Promineifilaceae bacterium]|nr:phosphate ABC transporter ATP-binding protein [Candidatus Promineifilaceae bacterium]
MDKHSKGIDMTLMHTKHAGDYILRTEKLSLRVDGRCLVDDVSVAVSRGDVVAVVGPSGAGKSRFLRLLNRLDEPTTGTVWLAGHDYRSVPPAELRRRVGLVAQRPYLFPGTVADNLRFGPRQRGERLRDEELERLLAGLALAGYAQRSVEGLSGGEAQRVALARTLANRPEVLLLDEPTSALDEAAVHEVETLLLGLLRERGLTCLLVSHDADQARRLADWAIVMDNGRVVRRGGVAEVLDA